jgi:hypothetical protein
MDNLCSGPTGTSGQNETMADEPVEPEVLAGVERNLALTPAQRLRQLENKMRLRGLVNRAPSGP